jgi:hypothetical protein
MPARIILAALVLAGAVTVAPAAPATASTTVGVTVPGGSAAVRTPPEGYAHADACATTSTGRRIACISVHDDLDARPDATVCLYDDLLGVFGWAQQRDVLCVESVEDWGFVSGSGVCTRLLGTDRPQACVNGRERCALWVLSIRIACR